MVYCKFLSVDSFVSFYHASPIGYSLAFLKMNITPSVRILFSRVQSVQRLSVEPWWKLTFKSGEFQFCFDWIVTWLWNDIRIIIAYFSMDSCARSDLVNFLCNVTWYLGFSCFLPENYRLNTHKITKKVPKISLYLVCEWFCNQRKHKRNKMHYNNGIRWGTDALNILVQNQCSPGEFNAKHTKSGSLWRICENVRKGLPIRIASWECI